MSETALPAKARKLIEVAEDHGWRVKVERDEEPVEGATESVLVTFAIPLASGRGFAFLVKWAKSSYSNRWQALKRDGDPVVSVLLPGDGSARDRVASLSGAALEACYWRHLSNAEWWLAHPERVARFDWVKDDLVCLCGKGPDHPDCFCERCVHAGCTKLLTAAEKELAWDEDGDEVWPLCGEHGLLYYTEDGVPYLGATEGGSPAELPFGEAT